MPDVEKTGYVQSYMLELHTSPGPTTHRVYFSVYITQDLAGTPPLEEFQLNRNTLSDAVDMDPVTKTRWAVSYGNVQQAMIATLKDALLQKKRVTLKGTQALMPPGELPKLYSVEIHG